MKNLFTYVLACLSIIILMASCGDSMSLTKRHYRSGYHFQRAGKNSSTVKHAPSVSKKTTVEKTSETVADKKNISSTKDTNTVLSGTYSVPNYRDVNTKTALSKSKNNDRSITASVKKTTLYKQIIKPVSLNKKTKVSRDRDDDSLSFFWLVILIILIFWIFGFSTGGWGLGGLIHVLLVIALILLILWLLKVI